MIEPAVWLPSAAGTMWSATAAAEPAEEPPGVCARLCGLRVLAGREQRQLGRHRLADDDGAGAAQGGNARRIAIWAAAAKDRGAVLGRQIGGVEDVFDADRHAVQRARGLAGAKGGIGFARMRQRELGIEMLPCLNLALALGDAIEAGA